MIVELESVFNIENTVLPFDYKLDLSSLEVSGIYPIQDPVSVRGEILNEAGMVSLSATVSVCYRAPCDRCAEPVERVLTIPVRHNLIVSLNDENNDDYIQVSDLRLDLDPLISEDVILALPVKFLCKETCKGLCPTCGKNLNDGPCGCKAGIDPRLEGLLQFLDEEDQKEVH